MRNHTADGDRTGRRITPAGDGPGFSSPELPPVLLRPGYFLGRDVDDAAGDRLALVPARRPGRAVVARAGCVRRAGPGVPARSAGRRGRGPARPLPGALNDPGPGPPSVGDAGVGRI